ncbi:hypothetical protein GCM10029964_025180 [Kibdelosporangium lantanae]
MTEPTGRRERKKAQTRRSLADAALRLFMERGFDQVGVKDVADEADVSVTTLFKHFPSKEALLFDEADDIEAGLVAAVRNRPPDQSIPHALKNHLTRVDSHNNDPRFADFLKLVDTTPALRDYAHRMWMRHETALAAAIAAETGAPPTTSAAQPWPTSPWKRKPSPTTTQTPPARWTRFSRSWRKAGKPRRHDQQPRWSRPVFALPANAWDLVGLAPQASRAGSPMRQRTSAMTIASISSCRGSVQLSSIS